MSSSLASARASILTCAEDGHVKCFNFDGDTYIDIDVNLLRCNVWSVPFDWIGVAIRS